MCVCLKTKGSNRFDRTIEATCEVDLNLSNKLPFPSASFILSGEWTGKSSKRASPGHFRCHSDGWRGYHRKIDPCFFLSKIARNPLTVTQTIGTQGHLFPWFSMFFPWCHKKLDSLTLTFPSCVTLTFPSGKKNSLWLQVCSKNVFPRKAYPAINSQIERLGFA